MYHVRELAEPCFEILKIDEINPTLNVHMVYIYKTLSKRSFFLNPEFCPLFSSLLP